MHVIRDSSEDEMILAFLAAEVDSPRFGAVVRDFLGDLEIVRNPDLNDATANQLRRCVLGSYRGWRRNGYLFAGFPTDVHWKLVEVTIGELADFRYANEPTWVALTGGTLTVRDGASSVGVQPLDEAKDHILAVEQQVRQGATFPYIIAVAEGEEDVHILLEGHARASAYVRGRDPQDTCELIAGYVASLSGWRWH